ncbi:Cor1/Xlr/Xmr family containing protein [Cricetulus griseus]|uniref:Cor1/Xlr/Xmr family containing protein n=1 Tax=Cricetulus griseus TaxID=10029 RepID=A0A061HUR8_CRIGR|nr:Cor1/Xlr/Xmr family containing protein [Cricetulus griseus]
MYHMQLVPAEIRSRCPMEITDSYNSKFKSVRGIVTYLCTDYGWINETIFFNPDMVCGNVPVNVGMSVIALVEEDETTHALKTIKVKTMSDPIYGIEPSEFDKRLCIKCVTYATRDSIYISKETFFPMQLLSGGFLPFKGDLLLVEYSLKPGTSNITIHTVSLLNSQNMDEVADGKMEEAADGKMEGTTDLVLEAADGKMEEATDLVLESTDSKTEAVDLVLEATDRKTEGAADLVLESADGKMEEAADLVLQAPDKKMEEAAEPVLEATDRKMEESEKSVQLPVEQQEHIAVYHYDIDYEREELEEMMEEADNELDYSAGSTSTDAGKSSGYLHPRTRRVPTRKDDNPGNEIMNKTEKIGANLSSAVTEKKRSMKSYIKGVVKDCKKNIKERLKFHEDAAREFRIEYTEQIITVFQEWDLDIKQLGDQEDKLTASFHQQQKTFQQTRMLQNHNLKGLKQENEEFLKDLNDLEDGSLLTSVRSEMKKQMSLLQKKITGS